jgi:hypothetical protein
MASKRSYLVDRISVPSDRRERTGRNRRPHRPKKPIALDGHHDPLVNAVLAIAVD